MDAKRSSKNKTNQSYSSTDSSGNDSPVSPDSPGRRVAKASGGNLYANDGSFLEMFKKKMEEEKKKRDMAQGQCDKSSANEGQSTTEKTTLSVTSFVRDLAVIRRSVDTAACTLLSVGKRRGGARLALKTGMVAKKQKLETEVATGKGDAWTKYMAEVKKYKAHQCGDDDKTRPLVK